MNRNKCNNSESIVTAVTMEGSINYENFLPISIGMHTSTRDEWILDSACPMHMCSKKNYFNKPRIKKSDAVTMGDVSMCNVEGMKSMDAMNIRMFNGTVHILNRVLYMPKIERNLIILTLHSEGFFLKISSTLEQRFHHHYL